MKPDQKTHGKLIHTLAARAIIRDLEEGGQGGYLGSNAKESEVKKEVVRLGEKYQLASKETSFVAVETRSGDRYDVDFFEALRLADEERRERERELRRQEMERMGPGRVRGMQDKYGGGMKKKKRSRKPGAIFDSADFLVQSNSCQSQQQQQSERRKGGGGGRGRGRSGAIPPPCPGGSMPPPCPGGSMPPPCPGGSMPPPPGGAPCPPPSFSAAPAPPPGGAFGGRGGGGGGGGIESFELLDELCEIRGGFEEKMDLDFGVDSLSEDSEECCSDDDDDDFSSDEEEEEKVEVVCDFFFFFFPSFFIYSSIFLIIKPI